MDDAFCLFFPKFIGIHEEITSEAAAQFQFYR